MFTDFVENGEAHGAVANTLQGLRYEPGLLRPWVDRKGQTCFTVNVGKKYTEGQDVPIYKSYTREALEKRGVYSPVSNALSMTKDAWIELDRAIVKTARLRLFAYADLAAYSSRSVGNAMGKTTFEYQAMNDPGEAVVDMDAMTDGRTDRPLFNLKSIPLPITHSDFYFSERELAVSRSGGMPLDSTMAEAAGRRVAEMIEKTTIGTETGVTFGPNSSSDTRYANSASKVYGYTNFPQRTTKIDLTTPTGSNPEAIVQDILEMIETMNTNAYYGPFVLYHSTPYSLYLASDYFRTGGTSANTTVLARIMQIPGIAKVQRLDYLTSGYQMILVQMGSDVAQAIDGMGVTTVMWPSQGGMRTNFKVMAIQVPLLKSQYSGTTGIIHGTTS